MKSNQRGTRLPRHALSLLELVAVVAIVGFLAAIVVPRYVTTTGKASSGTGEFQVSAMNATIDRYYLTEGAYPDQLSDLVPKYLPGGIPVHPDPSKRFVYNAQTGRVSAAAR